VYRGVGGVGCRCIGVSDGEEIDDGK